jgi:outer membrane protein assembly factor BamA
MYTVFNERQTLVFRAMAGLGVPYGNVSVLPFIKSYYGGGANGLRAWKIYTLGPGSYQGTEEVRFDRYGDIKLELNLEYRFKFYGLWHGAFFLDAGNVWFVRKNNQFPGGEFQFSQLGNDIALGGGIGIRLDFSFFILRIDGAVPASKTRRTPFKDQWISSWPGLRDYNLNLGIGYPF